MPITLPSSRHLCKVQVTRSPWSRTQHTPRYVMQPWLQQLQPQHANRSYVYLTKSTISTQISLAISWHHAHFSHDRTESAWCCQGLSLRRASRQKFHSQLREHAWKYVRVWKTLWKYRLEDSSLGENKPALYEQRLAFKQIALLCLFSYIIYKRQLTQEAGNEHECVYAVWLCVYVMSLSGRSGFHALPQVAALCSKLCHLTGKKGVLRYKGETSMNCIASFQWWYKIYVTFKASTENKKVYFLIGRNKILNKSFSVGLNLKLRTCGW